MVRKLKKSYIGVVKKFATGGKFLLKAYCKIKKVMLNLKYSDR